MTAPRERDFIPTLREIVEQQSLDIAKLHVAVPVSEMSKKIEIADRHAIRISDAEKTATWQAPSLAELYRGDGKPPADVAKYPEEYVAYYFFVERHFLGLCGMIGPKTDQEIESVYSMLRRRPDGKSIGPLHDAFWQVAALLLATWPLSEEEFAGIFSTLEGSARRWAVKPVSRFYAEYLMNAFKHQSKA